MPSFFSPTFSSLPLAPSTRRLASNQLRWFQNDTNFLWLNMSPGGRRMEVGTVAKGVERWFTSGVPLPEEWLGEGLKTLV